MDKNTLSNYGWIVIAVLVLAVMIALATPFGKYIESGVRSTTAGLFETSEKALNVVGMSAGEGNFEDGYQTPDGGNNDTTIPNGAKYYKNSEKCGQCGFTYGVKGMECRICNYNFSIDQEELFEFPNVVDKGNIYVCGDYGYYYNGSGWKVFALQNKQNYGTILESINNRPVTDMSYTFVGCSSLTTAPAIPHNVTNMSSAFEGCSSLTVAPIIPNNVTNMSGTFGYCSSLTTAPIIPNSVTNMSWAFGYCHSLTIAPVIPYGVTNMRNTFECCTNLTTAPEIPDTVTNMYGTFYDCNSLTGIITINANPEQYQNCFYACVPSNPITLAGSSSKLQELANTNNDSHRTITVQ